MNRLALHLIRLALPALLAAPLSAQLAQGAQTRLLALTLDRAGDAAGAPASTAQSSLGDTACGAMSSQRFRASVGFIASGAPHVNTAPVVFGVQPAFAPRAGGATVTLTGANFDNWGQGGSLAVTIGGRPATDVVLVSPSVLRVVAPAGDPGPADVVISSSLGSTTHEGGFLYTPAIITTPVVGLGDLIDLRNIGPPGDHFVVFVSPTTQDVRTRYGTLLIGPTLLQLGAARSYPKPDGVARQHLRVPDDAALVGLSVHFQSLSTGQLAPHASVLTNASTVSIP